MSNRNPNKPHRYIERNYKKTADRKEIYLGKAAILETWERFASDDLQIREYSYLLGLRKEVRQQKMYLDHRADPSADV